MQVGWELKRACPEPVLLLIIAESPARIVVSNGAVTGARRFMIRLGRGLPLNVGTSADVTHRMSSSAWKIVVVGDSAVPTTIPSGEPAISTAYRLQWHCTFQLPGELHYLSYALAVAALDPRGQATTPHS